MSDPTLLVLAAGIGSRYGGLKQADPVGPSGELIIHYSVYDALRAGFGKVVFLIRRDIEEAFRERVGRDVERQVDVTYAYQELGNLPPGFAIPAGRVKPWGTGHAVLCCRDAVTTNFAAINADDFYGAESYRVLAGYLKAARDTAGALQYSMVGYVLSNTLSEHGHVARGVCQVGPDGYLQAIKERLHIEPFADGVKFQEADGSWTPVSGESVVSMNMWGFTPSFFDELAAHFPRFLEQSAANPLKAEFLLPDIVGDLVQEGHTRVKVLPTPERWFGVTYQADRPRVQVAVAELIAQGKYPARLWA
ncbi:MAG: nucleotidyltransferase [Anaerolineae bacterium]|jgi:hypothetical protein|nr:nucleotidyltransferase [Anaerolineae bacterium]